VLPVAYKSSSIFSPLIKRGIHFAEKPRDREPNKRGDIMKLGRILLISALALFVVSTAAIAGDFDWVKDLNIQAQADPSGFRARLATRFKIGDVEVRAVLSNCESPADAYLVLRLGEMAGRPTGYVLERYRNNRGQGWGALAKSLGIKPGSEEFHALKRGHDLPEVDHYDQTPSGNKAHGKGKKKK
jgi:hypothetical protein